MMTVKNNNVLVTLSAPVLVSDTVINFSVALAPNLNPPETLGGSSFLTIVDSLEAPTKLEIVRYSLLQLGSVAEVVRGQQGTTAQDWSTGAAMFQGVTSFDFLEATAHPNAVEFHTRVPDDHNVTLLGDIEVLSGANFIIGTNSKVLIQ